jgi:hypothetical protein
MNVQMAYNFLMVRDTHVITMKYYWKVDIGHSESAKNWTLDYLEEVILR